jgi:hypothetical protein
MSNYKRFVPFSLLSATAAVIALAIAWEPGEAEANKPGQESPVLRTSIIETGGVGAPDCPDAVWPHVTKDCLLHQDIETAERKVRTIVIDDRTFVERRAEIDRLLYGK